MADPLAAAHAEPNYLHIFYALAVLTVFEIGVVFLPFAKLVTGFLLVLLACAKAALVALYFMHLKFERSQLGFLVLVPLALCVLLIFALLPDLRTHNKFSPSQKTTATAGQTPH